ncbi:MAG: SiaB family protein kinase [Bacteroidales bacterium]|nr:SiaB family protein kinase [Bacteroidales bacterium]
MNKQTLDKDSILKYQGQLNFEIIGHLLNSLKDETDARDIPLSHYKKILSVMIEILENVFKYNEYFEKSTYLFPTYSPFFSIEQFNGGYLLTSGNPILNKDIDKLQKHIDHINALDKEGLRQLFRTTLTNGEFSSKGGAGLGFIEMAKISGEKIEYLFTPIDETYSFYTCKVFISSKALNSD